MNELAIKDLLYKMADDLLILGHRNSEWTGFGPLLEEDIAFSSMAQDKIGQSYALFQMLHELGESDPDTVAFLRNADQFHNCQYVELPNAEYDFSLVRHFLFDFADFNRYDLLTRSSYKPLADLSAKLKGEVKYHILHAKTWITQLGTGTEESITRLQRNLNEYMGHALGIFEPGEHEDQIISEGIFAGEEALKVIWLEQISEIIQGTELTLPNVHEVEPVYGGRRGQHTKYLQPMLDEMSEVINLDPAAEW